MIFFFASCRLPCRTVGMRIMRTGYDGIPNALGLHGAPCRAGYLTLAARLPHKNQQERSQPDLQHRNRESC